MQAQGHAQMMVNMVDLGANQQASTDMARFYHNQVPNTLELESQLYNLAGMRLKAMGHSIYLQQSPPKTDNETRPTDGFYRAGSDHRKDGGSRGLVIRGFNSGRELVGERELSHGAGSARDATEMVDDCWFPWVTWPPTR